MFEGELFERPEAIERGALRFVPLAAGHFFAIDLQDSQRRQYGLDPREMTAGEAEAVAANPGCWAALRGETVLACLGVTETFPGAQGVAFGFLGKGIGRDHHVLTRFAQEVVIGECPLDRIEAIVRCADPPVEIAGSQISMVSHALQHPTPEVRWAIAVGLWPVAVLRKFGAAGETHMLFERIR